MEEWRLCLKKKFNMHFHVKEISCFERGREKKGAIALKGIGRKIKSILQCED